MDSIISTFHIDWKIIIAQAINFGVVFVVLYIFALKPLSKLMAERSEKISKGIDDAKESDKLLQKAAEEYKQNEIKLRQIGIDSQKELTKELDKLRAKNIDKIKADNNEWNKKRIEQMEIDKKALVESAKSELVTLAMQAANKIMAEGNKQNK
ncbi:MAG: ATP synthase F0 subunit B [Candidatus Paceibacterota bacterium]|jgi:F-type H+-transporting ATPase subunit b